MVCFADVLCHLFALLLYLCDSGLLLNHQRLKILKELGNLNQLLLDLLNGLMSIVDHVQGVLRLASTITLEKLILTSAPDYPTVDLGTYSLTEYLIRGTILNNSLHFLFGGVRVDHPKISRYLRLKLPPKISLDRLKLLNGSLQPAVHSTHLRSILRTSRVWLSLDVLEACGKVPVQDHGIVTELVKLPVDGGIRASVGVTK